MAVPTREQLEILADVVGVPVVQLCPELALAAAKSSPVTQFLDQLGLMGKRAAEKFAPVPVFRLPHEQLTLFLMVLFSCDGSVYVNAQGTPGLSYSTISLQLAMDVQHLLLRFGIVTRLRVKPMPRVRAGYTAYEVVGSGLPLVKQFLQQIGIYGRDEAKAAISTMRPPRLSSTHRDTIPVPEWFWQHLLDASGALTVASAARRAGVVLHPERKTGPLTLSTLQALATTYPTPKLHRLADNDLFWDEVAHIERAPGEVTLCIPVSDEADNLVINDLIVRPA
jgi:replicative DNA helicase